MDIDDPLAMIPVARVRMQTAVTAYLKSKQLLLFAFAGRSVSRGDSE